jgi:hypothetical protein
LFKPLLQPKLEFIFLFRPHLLHLTVNQLDSSEWFGIQLAATLLQAFQASLRGLSDSRALRTLRITSNRKPPSAARGPRPLRMSNLDPDNKQPDQKEENPDSKSLAERIAGAFKETEEGQGSPAEQTMSYLVDLFTVTAGAGIAMCLVFNIVFSIVPCIDL